MGDVDLKVNYNGATIRLSLIGGMFFHRFKEYNKSFMYVHEDCVEGPWPPKDER